MLTRFRICNWSSIKLRILTSEHRKLGDEVDVWRDDGVDNSRGLDHLVTYCSAVTVKFLARKGGGYIYQPFKMLRATEF